MTFTSAWRSPSNIALIKYWGKHGLQLPRNPSLSFTLSACHTVMQLTVTPDADSPGLQVSYEGVPKPSFEPKINTFFSLVKNRFPWLSNASVTIDSQNTFPHGAGIASSASAMSALSGPAKHRMVANCIRSRPSWIRKCLQIALSGSFYLGPDPKCPRKQ